MDGAVSAPSLTRRIVVSLVAIALVLGAGAAAFQRLAAMKKPPARALGGPPLPVVRVQPVTRGDYPETLRGYGVARALRVTHVAAEVTGIVEEVSPALRSGSRITLPPIGTNGAADNGRVGPPLVRIDDHDLQVALSRLRIEREQAATEIARWEAEGNAVDEQLTVVRERLETAKAELLRIEKLVPDTLPESDLDRQRLAVLALAQMESELASRKLVFAQQIRGVEARIASLEEGERKASKDIERTVVSAPFPGLVTARHVEQGDRVAPGSPLFDMIDPSLVEIAIALPAGRYGEVVRGSQAVIY
ncbi:MAG: HlyD family secretion protein, partial [Planctomycetota bacterium]